MAVSLKNLKAETAIVTFPIGGDTLTIEYRAHVYDKLVEDEVQPLMVINKRASANIALAKRLIISWDFKADERDAEPIPLTDEGLKDIPLSIWDLVFEGINEDRNPNRKTSTAS